MASAHTCRLLFTVQLVMHQMSTVVPNKLYSLWTAMVWCFDYSLSYHLYNPNVSPSCSIHCRVTRRTSSKHGSSQLRVHVVTIPGQLGVSSLVDQWL
ncbi:hypothetical protein BJV77DRAFT_971782 [Russula vinacea]|nr:hypothetical protein BJV77DRAFT_971782 [Russula vinacea]